jgi:uncharacterized protein YjbJ (UPF0337 family)
MKMKDSTKDKVEEADYDAKETIEEKIGHATNCPDLEAEGTGDKVAGKVQKEVGDIEMFPRNKVSLTHTPFKRPGVYLAGYFCSHP